MVHFGKLLIYLAYLQARKLYESAIYLEPEILRAELARGDMRFGESWNNQAIFLLERY
jgi:hypothetical protein